MSKLVGSIDQGTSSTRFTAYRASGEVVASQQIQLSRSTPHPGWVEQDPLEIINSVVVCLQSVANKLESIGYSAKDLAGIGITNQRETLVVWEKYTGKPLYNAIVWCDARNAELTDELAKKYGGFNAFVEKTGLPLSPYFTATKLLWLRKNCPEVQKAIDERTCLIGTIDTWVTWVLTGGHSHVTDVTNASRTMLMNIHKLDWDDEMLEIFGVPREILPRITSCAENLGCLTDEHGAFAGCIISGMIGDQQASLVGTKCMRKGQAKITFGTGCFLLCNTGEKIQFSDSGLITTVGYKIGRKQPVHYALEGSVATCGFAVQWLAEILGNYESVHELAQSVEDNGGVYFVPAFSGLLCPHWKPDARGCFLGITGFTQRGHLARACLEGIAFQAYDVLNCIKLKLNEVRVDGGLSRSDLLLQFQADLLGIDVLRGENVEATSKGAAIMAAYGCGLMGAGIINNDDDCKTFTPNLSSKRRLRKIKMWNKAVSRAVDWVEHEQYDEYEDD